MISLLTNKWVLILAALAVAFPTLFYFLKPSIKADALDDVGGQANISNANAVSIASQLVKAMDRNGTDEDTIFRVLTGLNLPAFRLVYDHFGIRGYNPQLGSSGSFFDKSLDLIQWLVEELSDSELNELKSLNPNLPL